MRSGCSSFVVVCNMSICVRHGFSLLIFPALEDVDANNATQYLGVFDTQEQAAHAVNAAIRRAGLEGKRRTNPVVDGQLVPRARKAHGHGPDALRKRRRDEPTTAPPSSRARRPRRASNYAEDPDFEP